MVHFETMSTIGKFIAVENLPDFMGGSGGLVADYRHVPQGTKPFVEMAQSIGVHSPKHVIKINDHFQKIIHSVSL